MYKLDTESPNMREIDDGKYKKSRRSKRKKYTILNLLDHCNRIESVGRDENAEYIRSRNKLRQLLGTRKKALGNTRSRTTLLEL